MNKTRVAEAAATYALSVEEVEASDEPIVLKHHGRPVAVIISFEEYHRYKTWKEEQKAAPRQETLADILGFDPNDKEKLRELGKQQRQALMQMAGRFSGGGLDVSERHDYYLYGQPFCLHHLRFSAFFCVLFQELNSLI